MKKLPYIVLFIFIASCTNKSRDVPINASKGGLPTDRADDFMEETPEEIAYWTVENLAESLANDNLASDYPDVTLEENMMFFGEGTIQRNVVILNKGTANEILISYEDGKPYELMFGGQGRWRTKHPIYIGLPLAELNEINEKPVKFAGFGWDYSGLINFDEGSIDREHYSVFLAPDSTKMEEETRLEFLGTKFFDSDSPDVEKLYFYVSSISYKL